MEEQWDYSLTDRLYRISPKAGEEPVFEMPAADWLDPEQAERALAVIGDRTKSVDLHYPASLAGLSLFNLCAAKLLLLARHNRFAELSLSNLTFQLQMQNSYTFTGYRIHEPRWRALPDANGDEYSKSDWIGFIRDHIDPAITVISRAAGVKPGAIWNQFGGQLANLREYLVQQEEDAMFIERFDRCVSLFTERLSPDVFGQKRNPFFYRPRFIDNPWQPEGRLIIRSSCCFFDCTIDGQKCYNCPRLTQEERQHRRESILAGTRN